MWELCLPNCSPLASMVWEEDKVTDGRTDKGRHAISLTSPLALLGRDKCYCIIHNKKYDFPGVLTEGPKLQLLIVTLNFKLHIQASNFEFEPQQFLIFFIHFCRYFEGGLHFLYWSVFYSLIIFR